MEKRLYRSRTNRVIGGVCGGLGEYFQVDPVIFRIIFVVLLFAHGAGGMIYLILMLVIPKEPKVGEAEVKDFGKRVENVAQEIKISAESLAKKSNDGGRMILASVIIIIGLVALLQQFFILSWLGWGTIWPVALVAVGLFLILKRE